MPLIRSFFEAIPGVAAVYLFGSAARNRVTPHSDVDIGVLFEPSFVPEILRQIEMRETLAGLLHQEVDLVVMNRANPILKHQIFKHGKLLLLKNKRLLLSFFTSSLNEYDDIKRVRAPIEKRLGQRRIYGG